MKGDRMRKKQTKNYPSRIRSTGGQTTLQSFLFKSRVVDEELKPISPPPEKEEEEPISPPQPPKREIIRVTTKAIVKEKASAFSSVGSSSSSGKGGGGALNAAALFRRFNSSAPAPRAEAAGDGDGGVRLEIEDIAAGDHRRETRKRKSPLGGDGEQNGSAKRVVVLGDDPKPRPEARTTAAATMRRRRRHAGPAGRGEEGGDQAAYNHYASGGGWWHGEMEVEVAKRAARPGTARARVQHCPFRHGPLGTAHETGRAVPAHVPSRRPKHGLWMTGLCPCRHGMHGGMRCGLAEVASGLGHQLGGVLIGLAEAASGLGHRLEG